MNNYTNLCKITIYNYNENKEKWQELNKYMDDINTFFEKVAKRRTTEKEYLHINHFSEISDYVLLYTYNNFPISFCALSPYRLYKNKQKYLDYFLFRNFVTHEKYRNKGIGSVMLKTAIYIAKKTNKDCILLKVDIDEDMYKRIRLYNRFGFVEDKSIIYQSIINNSKEICMVLYLK